MLYPLTFHPRFKERVWGGRNLERLYGKALPPGVSIGESWEICDRDGDVSVIENGPLAGKDLRWLMETHANELLGSTSSQHGRFPLLIKILDAREKLSLQVHPPEAVATRLGGEPKTEMWYVADTTPEAELYVGLKRGVTRGEFERRIHEGTVEECFHRFAVKPGDAMFLPSGRVHAIGAGNVIFEIQQNSDTTYRVFDWNRAGLDGKPRELHVEQSLASIDYSDFEPPVTRGLFDGPAGVKSSPLVRSELFSADIRQIEAGRKIAARDGSLQIIGSVVGAVRVIHFNSEVCLEPGQFCLIPASLTEAWLETENGGTFLHVWA